MEKTGGAVFLFAFKFAGHYVGDLLMTFVLE